MSELAGREDSTNHLLLWYVWSAVKSCGCVISI
jgi:hypothetical protein